MNTSPDSARVATEGVQQAVFQLELTADRLRSMPLARLRSGEPTPAADAVELATHVVDLSRRLDPEHSAPVDRRLPLPADHAVGDLLAVVAADLARALTGWHGEGAIEVQRSAEIVAERCMELRGR